MKYSFTVRQPRRKTSRATSNICPLGMGLLITARRCSVPASGAKVKPVRRPRLMASASSTEKDSMRRLGSETETWRSA